MRSTTSGWSTSGALRPRATGRRRRLIAGPPEIRSATARRPAGHPPAPGRVRQRRPGRAGRHRRAVRPPPHRPSPGAGSTIDGEVVAYGGVVDAGRCRPARRPVRRARPTRSGDRAAAADGAVRGHDAPDDVRLRRSAGAAAVRASRDVAALGRASTSTARRRGSSHSPASRSRRRTRARSPSSSAPGRARSAPSTTPSGRRRPTPIRSSSATPRGRSPPATVAHARRGDLRVLDRLVVRPDADPVPAALAAVRRAGAGRPGPRRRSRDRTRCSRRCSSAGSSWSTATSTWRRRPTSSTRSTCSQPRAALAGSRRARHQPGIETAPGRPGAADVAEVAGVSRPRPAG